VKARRSQVGFTFIESSIVAILVAVIGLVAVPQIVRFHTDTRDETTKVALSNLRSILTHSSIAIAMKEDPTQRPARFPTHAELSANSLIASAPANHRVLAGLAIADTSTGIPVNPWANTNGIHNCIGKAKGTLLSAPEPTNDGWCYNEVSGEIWANSELNSGAVRENRF